MACKICEVHRPRRACPGVGGEICATCCGTQREETVSCPLDCAYLREARSHEKPIPADPQRMPNRDIEISDSFLHRNEVLLAALVQSLVQAALATEGAVDSDVREALAALARTYRTRESGLYYETRPSNLLAAAIQERVQKNVEDFQRTLREGTGMTTLRDADILGVVAFLGHVEYQINNGRKRGRAFLDFLRARSDAIEPQAAAPGSLILP
jgi:hypothetical protein